MNSPSTVTANSIMLPMAPRLTTTVVLLLVYVGYLSLRRVADSPSRRAHWSAVVGVVGFVDVPIVHMSVVWWRTLHQPPTVLRPDLKVEMSGTMLFTLFVGVIAFTLMYVWLVIHRERTMAAEDAVEDAGLDLAIDARRAEVG